MTISATGNPAAAEKVLEAAGFTKGSNGFFQKGGKTLSITIISPSAYTDMAEVDSIAAQELKAAGIDASFQGLAVTAWAQDVADGDFQMTEHWSNGGITPYSMYNGWLEQLAGLQLRGDGRLREAERPDAQSAISPRSAAPTQWLSRPRTWCRWRNTSPRICR